MHDLHIRIPKQTHERLLAEALRHPKVKNKSDLVRLLIDASLGLGEEGTIHPALERIHRRLDELHAGVRALNEELMRCGQAIDDSPYGARNESPSL